MGRVRGGVSVASLRLLKRLEQSVDPRAADMRKVISSMILASEVLRDEAIAGWPVHRDRSGRPWKSKGSGGNTHSIDEFGTRTRITQDSIITSVYNYSPYGYFIRSHKTGRTQEEQRIMMNWRRGTSKERYLAQITVGPKRNAFKWRVKKPAKRIARKLAKDLQRELVTLLQNQV